MKADELRRQLEGYKLTYIAEQTGLHYNTVHRFMSGSDPKLSTAQKLSEWIKRKAESANNDQ